MLNFEPCHEYLTVEKLPRGVTAGGIALPDSDDSDAALWRILKVGPGRISEITNEPKRIPDLREGDIVMANNVGGVMVAGEQCYITTARDVVLRARPEPIAEANEELAEVTKTDLASDTSEETISIAA